MSRSDDRSEAAVWSRLMEQFSVEFFGLRRGQLATALEAIPKTDHQGWLDQRLAGQGFRREVDGGIHDLRAVGDE